MSDFEPTDKAKRLFDWLAPDLRRFYRRVGRRLTTNQLRLEINIRWGDQIVEKICKPNGMSRGECLVLAAIEAASPEPA